MNAFLWESINCLTGRLKNPACAFRNHYKGKGSKNAETSKYMHGSGRYADVFPVKEHRPHRLQTADREQTVQSVQTKCYFHLLVP